MFHYPSTMRAHVGQYSKSESVPSCLRGKTIRLFFSHLTGDPVLPCLEWNLQHASLFFHPGERRPVSWRGGVQDTPHTGPGTNQSSSLGYLEEDGRCKPLILFLLTSSSTHFVNIFWIAFKVVNKQEKWKSCTHMYVHLQEIPMYPHTGIHYFYAFLNYNVI